MLSAVRTTHMCGLFAFRRLGPTAAFALILAGGTLFAQLRDLSDDNRLRGDEIAIGLPSTVLDEDG